MEQTKAKTAEGISFYNGSLNIDRIKTYTALSENFNLEIGTVRDIFCAGLDFAQSHIANLEQQVSDLETALIITKNSRKAHIERYANLDVEKAHLEAQNKELREALEWIPITDRLPDVQVPVLVYLPKYGTPNINTMWIEEMSGQWFNTAWQFKRLDEVTHWMPLPEKPKGGKQDG